MKEVKDHLFLFVFLLVSFLLRFPSLFEPNWYGDEGIYQVIGKVLRSGGLLYRDIWDNKPPLLYLLYAVFNGELFWLKLLSLIFLLLSIIIFYFLAGKLFKKKAAVFLSTGFFTLFFSLPILEGNIANAENFMLLPIILAALLIINYTLYPKPFTLVISGLLLSLAFLTKIVAIFDLAAFTLFLFFISPWEKKNYFLQFKNFVGRIFPLILGFVVPIIFTFAFFLSRGVLKDFWIAAFSQNVNYVAWGNKFLVNQGFLIIKTVLLGLFVFFLFCHRARFSKPQLFILLWFVFSLFNALFAERPYTHYLLVLLPSFSFLLASVLEIKKNSFISVIFIFFISALIFPNFWFYGKTISYYRNFLSFISGGKSFSSYRVFFDPNVERNYLLAEFLNTKLKANENIFIWGESPQIYVLAAKLPISRFVFSHHINFYPGAILETQKAIASIKPEYLVILSPTPPYEKFLKGYKPAFIIEGASIYARNDPLP